MRIVVSSLALIYYVVIQIAAARQNKLDRKEGVSVFIYSPPKEARGSGLDTWVKNQQRGLKRLKRPIIRQTLDGRFVKDEVEGILLLTEEGNNEVFVPEELIVSTKKLLTFVEKQLQKNESFIDERNPVRRDTGNSEVKGKPFSFQYIVDDELTQNFQTRQEEGDAMGVVKGCYQLLEPDGMVRTVIYQADTFGFKVVSASKGPDKVPCSGSSDKGFQTPFQKSFAQNFGGKALSNSNNKPVENHQQPKALRSQKGSLKSFSPPTTVASQKEFHQSSDIGGISASHKAESMVSYINNLSETLFQSFKSVESKDVSNYVNFPFVLIPISTFFQLRKDGHIDDEVQGFGAVVQNPQGKLNGFPKSLSQSEGIRTDQTKFNQKPSGTNYIRESYGAPAPLQKNRDKIAKTPIKLNQNTNLPSKSHQNLNYQEQSKLDDSQPSQSQASTSFSGTFNNFGINKPSKIATKSGRNRPRQHKQGGLAAQTAEIGFAREVAATPSPLPSIEGQTSLLQEVQQYTDSEPIILTNDASSYSNYQSDEFFEDENFAGTTDITNPVPDSTVPQTSLPDADLQPTSINGFTVPAISILPLEYDHESSDLPFHDSLESLTDTDDITDILDQHAISSIGTQQIVDPNNEYIPPAVEGSSFGEKLSSNKLNNQLDASDKPSDLFISPTTIKTTQPHISTATSNQEIFPPEIPEGNTYSSDSLQLYQAPTQTFQGTFSSQEHISTQSEMPKTNIDLIQPYNPVIPKEKPSDFENGQTLTQLYESPSQSTAISIDGSSQIDNGALPNHNPFPLDDTPGSNEQSSKVTVKNHSQFSTSSNHALSKLNQETQPSFTPPTPSNQNVNLADKNGGQLSQLPVQENKSSQIPKANVYESFQTPKEVLTQPLTVANKNVHQNIPKAKESVAELYFVTPQFPNQQSQSSSYKNVPSISVTRPTINLNHKSPTIPIPNLKQLSRLYEPPKQNLKLFNKPSFQSKGSFLSENMSNIRATVFSQKQGSNQLQQAHQSDLTQLYQTPSQASTSLNPPLQKLDQPTQVVSQSPSHSFHNPLQTVDNKKSTSDVILMKPIIKQLYQTPSETGAHSLQASSLNQNDHIKTSHRGPIQHPNVNLDSSNLNQKKISSYSSQTPTINPIQNLPQSSQNFKYNDSNKLTPVSPKNFKQFNQATAQNFGHSLKPSVENQFQVGAPVKLSNQALENGNQRPSTDYQAPSITKLWPSNQMFQTSQKGANQASNLNNNQQSQLFQTPKIDQTQTRSFQPSKPSQTHSLQAVQKEPLAPKTYRAPKHSQVLPIPMQKQNFQQSSQISSLSNPSFHNFKQGPAEDHKQTSTQVFHTQNKVNNKQPTQLKQNLPQQNKPVSQISKLNPAQPFISAKQTPGHFQTARQNHPQLKQTHYQNSKPIQTHSLTDKHQNQGKIYQPSNQLTSQSQVISKQSHIQSFPIPMQSLTQNRNPPQSLQSSKQPSHQFQPFTTPKQGQMQALPERKQNPIQSYATSKKTHQQQQVQSIKQIQPQSHSFPSRTQVEAQFNQQQNQDPNIAYKPPITKQNTRNEPRKSNVPSPHLQNPNASLATNGRDKKIPQNSPDQFPEFGLKIPNSGSNSQQSSYSSVPNATSKSMKGWSPMTSKMMY